MRPQQGLKRLWINADKQSVKGIRILKRFFVEMADDKNNLP
jgi:hypothetical protein